MTDHSDLLGAPPADAVTPPTPKKRGRPAGSGKKTAATAETRPTEAVATPAEASKVPEAPSGQSAGTSTLGGANKEAAYGVNADAELLSGEAGADDTHDPTKLEQPSSPPVLDNAALDAKLDALAPVSQRYEEAMKNRVVLIGGGKREYAYQRVLRAGKKL
jgi:hypothetical protein